MHQDIKFVVDKISDKHGSSFWGSVTVTFQDGVITAIKTEETEKPPRAGMPIKKG